jgi:hypothetical protein
MSGALDALADLRFSRPLDRVIRDSRPALVGIAAMHALETDEVLALAAHVRGLSPDVPIVVGGHDACPSSAVSWSCGRSGWPA